MFMKLLNLNKIHVPLIQTGPDLNSRDDVINPLAWTEVNILGMRHWIEIPI